MAESPDVFGFKPEESFSKEKPSHTLVVTLPRVYGIDEDIDTPVPGKTHEVLLGMHTDMLNAFYYSLKGLKTTTQDKLFIEGRVLNRAQRTELYDDPIFDFFWSGRRYRAGESYQRDQVMKYVFPLNTKITEAQVRKYAGMNFSPTTLAEKIGYKVGWFNARQIVNSPAFEDYDSNSLAPMLGACNEFRIGSSTMTPGLLKMVQGRIIDGFRRKAGLSIYGRQPAYVKDKEFKLQSGLIEKAVTFDI